MISLPTPIMETNFESGSLIDKISGNVGNLNGSVSFKKLAKGNCLYHNTASNTTSRYYANNINNFPKNNFSILINLNIRKLQNGGVLCLGNSTSTSISFYFDYASIDSNTFYIPISFNFTSGGGTGYGKNLFYPSGLKARTDYSIVITYSSTNFVTGYANTVPFINSANQLTNGVLINNYIATGDLFQGFYSSQNIYKLKVWNTVLNQQQINQEYINFINGKSINTPIYIPQTMLQNI